MQSFAYNGFKETESGLKPFFAHVHIIKKHYRKAFARTKVQDAHRAQTFAHFLANLI